MLKNLVALVGILFIVGWFMGDEDDSASATSTPSAASAEDKRKGFHCLSAWDGSHPQFKREVKNLMRDPGSFEHKATYVTPVKEGRHTIRMEYRARNGFGGMNIGEAFGTFSNSSCDPIVLTVD